MEKRLSSREVYAGRIVRVRVDEVQTSSGRRTVREVVERPDTVSVLAIDDLGRVLLVRQYRYVAGQETLEIPAGTVDRGETGEEAARRELREETGFDCRSLEMLGAYLPAVGYSTEKMAVYLARDLAKSPLDGDEEGIAVVPVPFEDIHRSIVDGVAGGRTPLVEDGKSLIAVLVARASGKV